MQEFIHFAVNSPIGIIGWVVVIVVVFLFWPRGRLWLVAFMLILVLGIWAFGLIRDAVDRAEREVAAQVDEATDAASNLIPDWMQAAWEKVKSWLPSPEDIAVDKACDFSGIKIACEIYKKEKQLLEQLSKDMQQTEDICKASAEVAKRFGDAGQTKYCAGNAFLNAQRVIKTIGAGAVIGSVSSVSSLLVPNSPTLDSDAYVNCLYKESTTVSGANSSGCKYADRHQWRLCVEFHMQLPHEQLGQPPAALEPKILACRKQALGLTP
jgi:hypothetical protein